MWRQCRNVRNPTFVPSTHRVNLVFNINTKYCFLPKTKQLYPINFLHLGCSSLHIILAYLDRLAKTNLQTVKKNYIENVQHVFNYTISQRNPLFIYIFSSYVQTTALKSNSLFLAAFKVLR